MKVRPTLIAFALAAGSAAAQQPGQPPPGMGPGKGPGMMQGPGGGMGPEMMGGGGMMGEGHGMMGGRGMMGGGMGMGHGSMMGPLMHLDLNESQRGQIFKIQDDLRRKNWDLLGQQQDEQAKLRDAYFSSGKRDRAAIVTAYKRIADLRIQRIENSLDAAERIEGVLTQQQRDQLRRYGPWWMPGGER
ncbi:MAG: Spy/CpxP family protein refolding chaperone [Burkholderiales bacterium]